VVDDPDTTRFFTNRKRNNSKGWSQTTSNINKKKVVSTAPDAQLLVLLQWRNNHSCRNFQQPIVNIRRSPGVLKSPQLGVETVPMTLMDGRQVYIRRRNNSTQSTANTGTPNSTITSSFQSSCSLGVSMKELNRRVMQMKRQRLGRQWYPTTTKGDVEGKDGVLRRSDDELLWVDKHAPSSFSQLLSDERTNREVLRALRAWDPYVFGRQQPARPKKVDYYLAGEGQPQQRRPFGDENKKNEETTTAKNPNDKRPPQNYRVIMLSGPPGVGELSWLPLYE
jgi:hypothetical protein